LPNAFGQLPWVVLSTLTKAAVLAASADPHDRAAAKHKSPNLFIPESFS